MEKLEKVIELPLDLATIAKNVSTEKRNEVQNVLNHVFNGVSKMREQLDSINVVDENDHVNMKLANTIRLGVKNIRLDAEKTFDAKRIEVQQQMLSFKTEDSLWLKAKQTMQILTKEIEETAKYKEETAKRIEAERFELEMNERLLKIQKFNSEITLHDVRQFNNENFLIFLQGAEKQYNDRIEKEKAELLRLENERIEREKAIEAKILENERLKKEAEQREKELAIEREKVRKEKEAIELKAKKEAEKIAEQNRIEKEKQELILKKEREEKERLENELKTKQEQERKIELQRIEKEKAELLAKEKAEKAPIKEKLKLWVNSFYIENAPIENESTKLIIEKFEAFKKWAINNIENI